MQRIEIQVGKIANGNWGVERDLKNELMKILNGARVS